MARGFGFLGGLGMAAMALACVGTGGCSSDDADGVGSVAFTSWGEEYIEDAIPGAEFADGWTVTFDRFLVVLEGVTVAESAGGAPAASMGGSVLVNHKTKGEKPIVRFDALPAKSYPAVSFRVAPATEATTLEGATADDKALMVQNGYSVYVEAKATREAVTKSFAWGFKLATRYGSCKGEIAGKETDGTIVTNGGTDTVQLTIHGDHLFYDDLQAKEAKLRFDNIAAADADGDGDVTLEELARVKLAAIPAANGPYGTGSAAGVNDLRAFVEALSRTVGHFRGEGECVAQPD